jgi:hypothetical protein
VALGDPGTYIFVGDTSMQPALPAVILVGAPERNHVAVEPRASSLGAHG